MRAEALRLLSQIRQQRHLNRSAIVIDPADPLLLRWFGALMNDGYEPIDAMRRALALQADYDALIAATAVPEPEVVDGMDDEKVAR